MACLSFVSESRQLIQFRWFGLFRVRFLNTDFAGPPRLVLLRMMRSGRPSSCRIVSSFLLIDRNDRPHLIVARFLRLKFMKLGTRIQKIRTCALLGMILFQIIRALFKLHFLFLLLLFRFFVVFLFYVWCLLEQVYFQNCFEFVFWVWLVFRRKLFRVF